MASIELQFSGTKSSSSHFIGMNCLNFIASPLDVCKMVSFVPGTINFVIYPGNFRQF